MTTATAMTVALATFAVWATGTVLRRTVLRRTVLRRTVLRRTVLRRTVARPRAGAPETQDDFTVSIARWGYLHAKRS